MVRQNISKIKVAHLTSVHSRYDVRIFLKQCCSLSKAGYVVFLVVADGKGDEVKNGVCIYDVGAFKKRWDRIINAPRRVLKKAREIDATVYHLHDPELLPIGLKLKRLGKRVIFDSHEDVPEQVLNKPYLIKPLRWLISQFLRIYERYACNRFDGVICASPFILDKFTQINERTANINNFPLTEEFTIDNVWTDKKKEICYLGGISKIRGIFELIQAMDFIEHDIRLNLCGKFDESVTEHSIKSLSGWDKVIEYGFVSRAEVRTILAKSIAGLVTLLPASNYVNAQPNKMFEYMSASIPVIASNFPLWREIIEGGKCGFCVDPLDPKAIATAINYIANHPAEAEQMGKNGHRAVLERYNWGIEEKKLITFYKDI